MTITVHRVVLALGEHRRPDRELWHHDFRCAADAEAHAARLRFVGPVRDGREHVHVLTVTGEDGDPRFMPDEVIERFLRG